MLGRDLHSQIAGCARCPEAVVNPDWLPVSYFGNFEQANSWVVSINPSAREFLDRDGQLLLGPQQRLPTLQSFPKARSRQAAADQYLRTVLAFQDSYFDRVPYRPYFNRLGRFLARVHGAAGAPDPLLPFTEGVGTASGKSFRYAHLDIVKCATRAPWSGLSLEQQQALTQNCQQFFEQQLREGSRLRLLVVNGRTACRAVLPAIASIGFCGSTEQLCLRGTSFDLVLGSLRVDGHAISVLAWTANVVNQWLSARQLTDLVEEIWRKCPSLR